MKKSFTLALFLLTSQLSSIAQQYQWAKDAGGSAYDVTNKVMLDYNSNIVASCYSRGNITLGSNTFPDTASYLVKYDTTGNILWSIQCGKFGNQNNTELYCTYNPFDVDASNNIFMAGFFETTGMLGTVALSSPFVNNMFLARVDASGQVIWHRNVAVNGHALDLTLDAQKNIIVTGYLTDTAHFDSYTFINLGATYTADMFVAKYDSVGNLLWVKRAGSATGQGENAYSVSLDNTGSIFLSGVFAGNMLFDTISLIHPAGNNLYGFVAKYDSQGNAIWAKRCGTICYNVKADNMGNLYTAGRFEPYPMNFDTDTIGTWQCQLGLFISKLDTSGNFQWIKIPNPSFVPLTENMIYDFTISSYGNLLCQGIYSDTLSIDNVTMITPLAAYGRTFILEVNPSGQVIAGTTTNNTSSIVQGGSIDSKNCIVAIGGRFRNTPPPVILGNDSLFEVGGNDMFVARIGDCKLTAIPEINKSVLINVSPNPFRDEIRIVNSNYQSTKSNLQIFDLFGRLIYESILTSNERYIHLGDKANGIYFVRITDGENVFSNKIFKQ